jgi:mannose-6-phosphate isomerase-like protein (cupin superfamily)
MPGVIVSARVVDAYSVAPRASSDGPLSVRATVGLPQLQQELLECAAGRTAIRATGDAEEALFVLSGRAVLSLDGIRYELEPESGACLAPGEEYRLENDGPEPLALVAVRIPEPVHAGGTIRERTVVRRLADQAAEEATTDRSYRVIADPATGLRSATLFVGYIPTVRAPDHYHTYDEVIFVIDGEGLFHAEGESWPLRAGSCVQLPARTVHCLENTGREVMRIVAAFRPAGSPAEAYYPDGRPAYAPAQST